MALSRKERKELNQKKIEEQQKQLRAVRQTQDSQAKVIPMNVREISKPAISDTIRKEHTPFSTGSGMVPSWHTAGSVLTSLSYRTVGGDGSERW